MPKLALEDDDVHPKYKEATVHAILLTAYKGQPKPSISTPALHLTSELIRLYTMEAIHRAAETAKTDISNTNDIGDNTRLDVNHLHKNAAALTLDFGG